MAVFTLKQLHCDLLNAHVLAWHKQPGETLVVGDALLSVRDKDQAWVLMTPVSGELQEQLIEAGHEVNPESQIALIAEARPQLLGKHRHIEARVQQDRRKKISAERLRNRSKD